MKVIQKLSVVLVLALIGLTSFAQNRTISGTVLDNNGQPVIAAAVMIKGSTVGEMTDSKGKFTISVPSGNVVLNVSSLGYVTKDVAVPEKQSVVVINLEEDNMLLNETVVVGYGTQKKVNLTGAISTVSDKDLENRVSHSVSNMLQGAVPGLNVSTSAGNPGSNASINIRGITSINGASPIVLVDGAIGDLNRVNPNDVASISVIKDAAAAAVYGARAAFGVVLITTKSGATKEGKATVRYSSRFGWEQPTTNTDYETRGYWSVYTVNLFYQNDTHQNYIQYNDNDMQQLLARVNDKKEDPSRPWVVEEMRNGKNQWVYYANTDYWHYLFNDKHPVQEHNISISGGTKDAHYYLSGGYDHQVGILKTHPDIYNKFNLRAKFDFKINKYAKISNNTAMFNSKYTYQGVDNVQNAIAYSARHFLACFTPKNPDGSWLYATPYINYKVGNGRHIALGNDSDVNKDRKTDFSNTTELTITPVKQFWLTANYTYRFRMNRNTNRLYPYYYRQYPGEPLSSYTTGAGKNVLSESTAAINYYSANIFGTYEDTFGPHHVTAVVGYNMETENEKDVSASGENIQSETLNDLDLVGPNATGAVITSVGGGQTEYALMGFFGRFNYDYKGKYLFEASGRYDGTSRFADGHRWGFFPSFSAGWRVSEEPFFTPVKGVVNNLKLRASFGSLGNQNVSNYAYLRKISFSDQSYTFNEGTTYPKYSSISAPNAANLTWEKTEQYNLGVDADAFNSRLQFTGEVYIRDTKNMLTDGVALPSVYGADSPKMNAANLRTSGYELSLNWRDQIKLAGKPFGYYVKGMLSDYRSIITKYDNPKNSFAKDYYKGERLGEIWGFVVDGLFDSDEEAKAYTNYDAGGIDCSYIHTRLTGGFLGGDCRYVDLDGDRKISLGQNTVDNPGDRKKLGNSLASLQYGFQMGIDWLGFDLSAFFQGTGNHYWYPTYECQIFWGPYSNPYCSYIQKDFLDKCWAKDNKDAYFPLPRSYSAHSGQAELGAVNSRYLQNMRYLRFKNLTFGYTLPKNVTMKAGLDEVRVYFSGENLDYWSPFKKLNNYIDPEAGFNRSGDDVLNNAYYPWQKTYMFGIDINF